MAAALLDLRRDGVTDLAVLDRAGNTVSLLASRLLPLPDSVSSPATMPAARVARLVVSPNPARTRVSLTFGRATDSGEAFLTVYDIAGRRVRRYVVGHLGAAGSVSWDLRDDARRAVPAGVYRVELREGDTRRSRALVVVD